MALRREVAFILKNKRAKESDKIITFFGNITGKFQAIAKGAERPEVRKSGNLETGLIVKLSLAEGYKLEVVTEVEPILYPSNKKSIHKIILYLAELIDKYTIENDPNQLIFKEIESFVAKTKSSKNIFYHLNELHLKLMQQMGYLPDFRICAKTGSEISNFEKVYLSESGPVSPDYSPALPTWPLIKAKYFEILGKHDDFEDTTTKTIEKNLFKILNFISEKNLDKTFLAKNLF